MSTSTSKRDLGLLPSIVVEGDSTFEQLVEPLRCDRSWRRQVRLVRAGHLAHRAGRAVVLGLCQMGGCLMGYAPTFPPTAAEPVFPRVGHHA